MAKLIVKLTRNEREELRKLLDAYDAARSELLGYADTLYTDKEGEIDARSDRWRVSDAGKEAQARLDTLAAWVNSIPEDNPFLAELWGDDLGDCGRGVGPAAT